MSHDDIGVMPLAHRMGKAGVHLGDRHGAHLRWTKASRSIGDARHRQLYDAAVSRRSDLACGQADPAPMFAKICRIDATVPGYAQRRKSAQSVVVGAEIAGSKSADRGRARLLQHLPRDTKKCNLIGEAEIADIMALSPFNRRNLRPLQPFAMDMELNLMAPADDLRNDRGEKVSPVHERGQGVEEEHALETVPLHNVHLPADAERTLRGFAPDRPRDIVRNARALLMQKRGQFGVDGDEQRGHVFMLLAMTDALALPAQALKAREPDRLAHAHEGKAENAP